MNEVTIHNTIDKTIKDLQREMPAVERKALSEGAVVIRDSAKSRLVKLLPAATKSNIKYNDTLQDAVLMSRVKAGHIRVHIMGNNQTGSGGYRLRFFEGGTKQRYQKKRNGVRLPKKHWVGRITELNFFRDAVASSGSKAVETMKDIINDYIQSKN